MIERKMSALLCASVLLGCFLLGIVLRPFDAHCADSVKVHLSPDKGLIAKVISIGANEESIVEIHEVKGRLLARQDHVSEDGEHGLIEEKAGWSADSRFFVYVSISSGGHQPWHAPMYVYYRKTNRFHRMTDCLGSVHDPAFELRPPDVITFKINTFPRQDTIFSGSLPITFHLADLIKACDWD